MLAQAETGAASVAVRIGLILGIAGGLVIAYGALRLLRPARTAHRSFDRALERGAMLVGFLLIAAGFGVRLLVELGRLFR
jgi:hypothetical protein